jgi:hypothetical protein
MVVRGVEWSPYFELRDYGTAAPGVVEILGERGIRPALQENGRLLFAFETLVAREKAWRNIGADPVWVEIGAGAGLREIAVYRSIG